MLTKVSSGKLAASLAQLASALKSGTLRVLENTSAAAEHLARSTRSFKDRTGELRSSIHHTVGRGYTAFVRAESRHAGFIENGTRPHPIVARRGPYLKFMQNGALRFARHVRHPGVKARHFMANAAKQVTPIFNDRMHAMSGAAIARFNR